MKSARINNIIAKERKLVKPGITNTLKLLETELAGLVGLSSMVAVYGPTKYFSLDTITPESSPSVFDAFARRFSSLVSITSIVFPNIFFIVISGWIVA